MSAGYIVTAVSEPTAAQVIDRWLGDLDVREGTKRGYERNLRQFVSWMDDRGLNLGDATRADILAYRSYLADNYGASTTRAYMVPVKSLFRWAARETGQPSIVEGVRSPQSSKAHAKDALTKHQARQTMGLIEERADEGKLTALRDAAVYRLMMTCGLRTIEVVRADVGDLRNIGDRRVLYVQGKGRDSKDDYVELPAPVAEDIDRYLMARGTTKPTDPLFCGHGNRNHGGRISTRWVSKMCKETMKAAGYDSPRLTAHSLRHTAVTASLLAGASLQQAQAMARHERIETTLIYSHNLDRLGDPAEERAASYFEEAD